MNNIQMSDSEARSIRSLFDTPGWRTYLSVMRNAREKARDVTESSTRDEVTKKAQGASLALKEICNIEKNVYNILKQ